MRKSISLLLAVLLLLTLIPVSGAAEPEFFFALSVDGTDKKEVQTGDIITVVFHLNRVDSDEDYTMYAMQNEIRYDSTFFQLVEGSALLSNGISTTDIGLRDAFREFYMNFVSLSGGESWEAQRLVGSFQLKVVGTSGVSKITNQDYLVSTADGQSSYPATCQDVTVVISSECTVDFASNGGTEVPSQTVIYGEKVVRPTAPTREGYHLVGWYADMDLQIPWDFDADTVQGNMTLYAKWEQGTEIVEVPEKSGGFTGLWWLLIVALLLAVTVLLVLLLGKKTVHFETGCKQKIKDQRVKKGGYVTCPEDPKRLGRSFAGWYFDEERTEPWDFETDAVQDNMTLYAKWM